MRRLAWVTLSIALPAALAVSCGSDAPSPGAEAHPAAGPAAEPAEGPARAGWVHHADPRGFVLSTPRGWTVTVIEGAAVAQDGSGNWQFTDLYGYVAAPDAVPVAEEVLAHMVGTFQLNPQWVAMQQGLTANVSKIVRRTGQEISKMLRESYEQRQAAQDDTFRKVSNALRGQTDLRDPETGETWKVEYGHNYYWRRAHTNELTGTRTPDRPDIDFQPLEEW